MASKLNILNHILTQVMAIAFLLTYVPFGSTYGVYNSYSDLAYCTDHLTCLHEVGHALDDEAGWISQSTEINLALNDYVLQNPKTEISVWITATFLLTKQDPWKEIYAWLYAVADGNQENMAPEFRKFYDWDRASEMNLQVRDGFNIMYFGGANPVMAR